MINLLIVIAAASFSALIYWLHFWGGEPYAVGLVLGAGVGYMVKGYLIDHPPEDHL